MDHQDEAILHYGDGTASPGGGVTTLSCGTAMTGGGTPFQLNLTTGCITVQCANVQLCVHENSVLVVINVVRCGCMQSVGIAVFTS